MAPTTPHRCAAALILALFAPQAFSQTDSAYSLVNDAVSANRLSFFVYRDHDSGLNQAYPSGLFPEGARLETDSACTDDPTNTQTGCASDTSKFDCTQGTVFRLTWSAMSTTAYAGLNFEEPEHYGTRRRGAGYDLRPATHLVFRYRSPTGISVQFGVNDGRAGFATNFIQIQASAAWNEMRIALADLRADAPDLRLDPSNVHIPFYVVTNGSHAANGGTLLLDDVRFEPVPARQSAVPGFPLSNQTCGVIPAADKLEGRVEIPPDQINRNLATTYESALALWALLRRGTENDLANARFLADALAYAVSHDNTGFPLPKTPERAAGFRNAYINGDLPFFNDQQCPGSFACPPSNLGSGARKGDARLAGFGIASSLCGDSHFCLVLDGATGGNNAFAIIALLAAYRRLGDVKYVDAARSVGNWIHGMLLDPNPEGFGGYFAGFPDEGKAKNVIRGKSVENNADIAAAFQMLADVESELCHRIQAETWADRSRTAGDFVMRMFDPITGRFFAGTVPVGTGFSPGIKPDGEQRGQEVVNTWDFLDANTFVPLALTSLPRYRNAVDWRRPLDWASKQVQRIRAGGRDFEGFNIVERPVSGPTGIAWEFTGQMVVAFRVIDALYGENRYRSQIDKYLAQIAQARSSAPFSDGRGLVASTMEGGDQLPVYQQCLSTPFQCIAQRVGLAATLWGVFAEGALNPLSRGAIGFESMPAYVNAASFNGCLSPGGLFSLFQGGAAAQTAIAAGFPLPVTLGGSQVRLGGRPAPLIYAGPSQVNGQLPYETSTGDAAAELVVASTLRSQTSVRIAPVAPGIFLSVDGLRCVAYNFSGTLNSPLTPAQPGDGVTVYLTGIGSVQNPVGTGLAAPLQPLSRTNANAVATIGGEPARIPFFGLTPGTAGVGQANLEPNAGLAPGNHELVITLDGIPSNKCMVSLGQGTTYPAPTIVSVTPNTGPASGGARATIRGGGYWSSGMAVRFGATAAREITHVDRTTLVAVAPPGSGVVDVAVTTPDNRTAVASRAFTYAQPAPSLAGISPGSGVVTGGTPVTITGANFRTGAVARFGNSLAADVVVSDGQTIRAMTPAGSGTVDVAVVNSDGQSAVLTRAFTYKTPVATNPTITARTAACRVAGSVAGVDPPDGFRMVVYAFTNQFYLQPCATEPRQPIASDLTWGPVDSHSGAIYVLLVRAGYDPPPSTQSLPVVDGVDVFAAKGPVGSLISCDVARCPAQ